MGTDNNFFSVLPPLYCRWMEQLLGGSIPPESEATCNTCVMLCPEEVGVCRDQRYFRADAKCCTYMPKLPNFLVGQALIDNNTISTHGRATIERRLAGRVAVTPLGCDSGSAYDLLYRRSAFGQNLRLLCPHFLDEDGGRCGIWQYRNSVCATWFCVHMRGAVGKRFWEALNQLLGSVEDELACWCLSELVADMGSLRHLFPRNPQDVHNPPDSAKVDEVVDLFKYSAAWGGWLNRVHDFYRECGRLVGQLSWREVTCICGPQVTLLARLAQAAYAELLSEELPATLRVGVFNILDLGRDQCRLTGYSTDDSLDVPRVLLRALPYFNGRPWPEAVAAVLEGEGIKLDRSLVLKLVDSEILVPGDANFEHGHGIQPMSA